jgi:hypothetical protein
MNDDASTLRSLLPVYAGQADVGARRTSDQQVRAWTGESLVDLQDRVSLEGFQERFDRLLMRCEFGDQHVIKGLEQEAFDAADAAAALERHDARIVAAAARAKTVAADALAALFDELERAFDARAAAIADVLEG